MSDDKNFPAYPLEYDAEYNDNGEVSYRSVKWGMTARDVFAKDAPPVPEWFKPQMQGIAPYEEAKFFEWCWYYADRMLETR